MKLENRQLIIEDSDIKGKSVIYIMSRDQRSEDNHAILSASEYAQRNNLTLYVLFVLKNIKGRSREHYKFMIDGLEEVSRYLEKLNIPFILRIGKPEEEISSFAREVGSNSLFFDFSPLNGARSIVKTISKTFEGSVTIVDTHNIVPLWIASDKQEFAAHTMRTKIHRNLAKYLEEPQKLTKQKIPNVIPKSADSKDIDTFVKRIPESGIVVSFKAGQYEARKVLSHFLEERLANYANKRNDISVDNQSNLSPYLHFGQLSSLRVALELFRHTKKTPLLIERTKLAEPGDSPNEEDGMNVLYEEMIVRKELSDNFCFYNKDYLSLDSAPKWALETLGQHSGDKRESVYTQAQLEEASTHDRIWNSAQIELMKTGKMHGYMRMYWAKKMLEWTESPKQALSISIYLNDKYSLDGGDPNGYVGILWSLAGLHDRPWFERPVFGNIRYMNESGLRRKFDTEAYIKRIESL